MTNAFVLFPEPNSVSYGCGWMNREVGHEPYFQHDGGNNGFQADFARDPRKGVAVVVLENLGFGYPLEANVRHSLMDILLK